VVAVHKGEIPFVIFLIPFLAGIACGLDLFPATNTAWLYAALAFFSAIFISLNLFYKRFSIYKKRWLGGALMHLVLFIGGWICVINYNELNANNHFSKTPSDFLIVKITSEPRLSNGIIRFTAEAEQNIKGNHSKQVTGNLLIAIKDSAADDLYYGDKLLVPGSFRSIAPPANPAEFNYKRYLANQNIHFQEFLYAGQYFRVKRNTGNALIAYALRQRQHLVDELKLNMHNPEAIAVASTLILGYKADLSNDVLQAYSKTGTIHVLSVSGAHVAILYILLELMFGFMVRFKYGRTIKTILITLIIWYYAMLSGFSPAVCRAAFMISMVIIGKTYNRTISTLNILGVSAFFLLFYNPLFIDDVGFQLSYLSVAGLIILQPVVYKLFSFKNKWVDKLWALCSVSLAAQLITFPLSAFYFHQFPVYFLVSNLFIIIPSAVIMYAGVGYFLLGWIPFFGKILGFVLEQTILLMDKGLSVVEHSPFASIGKIWLTRLEYLLLYAIIIALFYFINNTKVWLLRFALCSTLILTISISFKRWNNLGANEVTVLNLRKHTGIIFRSGDHAIVLTDLKDTDKTYRYSVQPYLDSCQVAETKILHPDSDLKEKFLLKKGSLISFKGRTILLYNKDLESTILPQKLKVDYLLVTGNSATQLSSIDRNFEYQTLIIDNNQRNLLTNKSEERFHSIKVNYINTDSNKLIKPVSN
jgi:competence protein ComEC